jgi:hypothetical protein
MLQATRKSLVTAIVVIGLALSSMFFISSSASANPGDVVYQTCSSFTRNHEVTIEDNGIEVICEEWPMGGDLVWMPVLRPNPIPTVAEFQQCYVPGLVGKTGSNELVCSRHFDKYVYWDHI